MDHKTWLWRKKSSEKMIVASEKSNTVVAGNEDESVLAERLEMESDLKRLRNKLSSILSECNAKDDLVQKQEKMAQEAIAGWEMAEAEVIYLKKSLDEALQQRVAGEERFTQLDLSFKECTKQLLFVREEQEHRIHDAVMKTTKEHEKSQSKLEDKLLEASKKVSRLGTENNHLSKVLQTKEKLIEDLTTQKILAEGNIDGLMVRFESMKKDNASLEYEVRVLEKEVEIRSEERDFNHRTENASQRKYVESVRKIAKLESECQRLRLLVRKRLPGPAALTKMKNEIEMIGHDPTLDGNISFLIKQLRSLEDENKTLKEALDRKTNEVRISRVMDARSSQLEELSKCRSPRELSLALLSEVGSFDKVSSSESTVSALISELEHFKNRKQKGSPSIYTVGASEINLMDDFVEMEKLAIISVDKSCGSHVSCDDANILSSFETESTGCSSEAKGMQIVPVLEYKSENQETKLNNLVGKLPGWLEGIVKVIYDENSVKGRTPDEILADIRSALGMAENPAKEEKASQQSELDLNKSIGKMIELIEGITPSYPDYGTTETESHENESFSACKTSKSSLGYVVRVFQWKTSELFPVLQQFIHTCNDLLNGKCDINKFVGDVCVSLDWIMNHCFSLQDVSTMRQEIKKNFDWDESRSESGELCKSPEPSKPHEFHCSNGSSKQQNKDLEKKLRSHANKEELFMNKLPETKKSEKELVISQQLKQIVENQKLMKEHIELQLTVANAVEPGNRDSHDAFSKEEKQLRTGREITTASEKLAECQEAILNLGKQLKALSSPQKATISGKVASVSSNQNTTSTTKNSALILTNPNPRSSLLDKMLDEDNSKGTYLTYPESLEKTLGLEGIKQKKFDDVIGSLAIVPIKKTGAASLWSKLLRRQKRKGDIRYPAITFTC